MADLLGTQGQAVTKHLRNVFASKELQESAVCPTLEHTANNGKKYKTKLASRNPKFCGYHITIFGTIIPPSMFNTT